MDIALVRDYYSSKSNNIKSFVIILQVFVNNKLETSTIIQAQDKEKNLHAQSPKFEMYGRHYVYKY